jgi:hypothetical protein
MNILCNQCVISTDIATLLDTGIASLDTFIKFTNLEIDSCASEQKKGVKKKDVKKKRKKP